MGVPNPLSTDRYQAVAHRQPGHAGSGRAWEAPFAQVVCARPKPERFHKPEKLRNTDIEQRALAAFNGLQNPQIIKIQGDIGSVCILSVPALTYSIMNSFCQRCAFCN